MINTAMVGLHHSTDAYQFTAGQDCTDPAAIVAQVGGDIIGKPVGMDEMYIPKDEISAVMWTTTEGSSEPVQDEWCVAEDSGESGE